MSFRQAKQRLPLFAALCIVFLLFAPRIAAQSTTGTLHGQVTDPSGAAVPNASVQIIAPTGQTTTAKTGRDGLYEVKGLAPAAYTVQASASGFEVHADTGVTVLAGQSNKLDIALDIAIQQQQVEVKGNPSTLDVNPENNAGAIVLSGKDLDALSDDPDELQSDLEALAGPSVGPNGGQMYIDGFTAGQLPPKSSIREIRINQNPFSAEYDKLGYGRIEVFTKPGTDQFHGQFFVLGNDSAFNSRNPFLGDAPLPGYYTTQYNGSIGGPLSKRASFFFTAQHRNINDVEVVNAELQPGTTFTQAVPNPRTRTNIGPRLDYQVSKNNTLSVRYQYYRDNVVNDGVGQFALASQGYNLLTTEQTLQVSDTQVIGSKIVYETRFQYLHDGQNQATQSTAPQITVPQSFVIGGNSLGNIHDDQNHYELQSYTQMSLGKNILKFGARLRDIRDINTSTANFNGTFIFANVAAYQGAEQAIQQGLVPPTGDNPIQFSLTTGIPSASVSLFDAGLYVQDDWRWRPNVTLSGGVRFETQDHISNHADWAPRLAIAWGIGRGKAATPKTVLRAGWGIFYDRFAYDLVLQAERQNGVIENEYIVTNPSFFPAIPPVNELQSLSNGVPTKYQIASNLHAPYTLQTAISLERQVSKAAHVTVTYVNARGVHQLLTDNINAPLPDTYIFGVPTSGVRPLGILENVYQYESEGIFKQNQIIANVNVRVGTNVSLNGYYALNYASSDTSGASSFPTNPYNISADYGRAAFDVRDRAFLGGAISLRYGVQLSPFMVLASGTPFDVTTGTDLNGDSILNQRPALVSLATCPTLTAAASNIVCTPLGTFNTMPAPGEKIIPINSYTGPGQFTFNLRVAKTFSFGAKKEVAGTARSSGGGRGGFGGLGGGRGPGAGGLGGGAGGGQARGSSGSQRYSLTFSVNARNLFNVVNVSPPAGSLGSRKFDTSNALAGGAFGNGSAVRQIQLQMQFTF